LVPRQPFTFDLQLSPIAAFLEAVSPDGSHEARPMLFHSMRRSIVCHLQDVDHVCGDLRRPTMILEWIASPALYPTAERSAMADIDIALRTIAVCGWRSI
jgi:hypothetical protein